MLRLAHGLMTIVFADGGSVRPSVDSEDEILDCLNEEGAGFGCSTNLTGAKLDY